LSLPGCEAVCKFLLLQFAFQTEYIIAYGDPGRDEPAPRASALCANRPYKSDKQEVLNVKTNPLRAIFTCRRDNYSLCWSRERR
jgi:hypothetical protein